MDVDNGPSSREVLESDRGRGRDGASGGRFEAEFVGERQGETAGLSGGDQSGGAGMGAGIRQECGVRFELSQRASAGGGRFGAAFPGRGGLANDEVHGDIFGRESGVNQYFVG